MRDCRCFSVTIGFCAGRRACSLKSFSSHLLTVLLLMLIPACCAIVLILFDDASGDLETMAFSILSSRFEVFLTRPLLVF